MKERKRLSLPANVVKGVGRLCERLNSSKSGVELLRRLGFRGRKVRAGEFVAAVVANALRDSKRDPSVLVGWLEDCAEASRGRK